MVMKQAKPQPEILASQVSTGLSLGCSISDPASYLQPGKALEAGLNHRATAPKWRPEEAPGFQVD